MLLCLQWAVLYTMLDLVHSALFAGHEPSLFAALMDPPALDPEAQRINARRASITGEIPIALTGATHMDM